MNFPGQAALIATAIVPLAAAAAALIAGIKKRRDWCLRFARFECAAGAVCGLMLVLLLTQAKTPAQRTIRLPLWEWFSFAVPGAPAVVFGLDANAIKAAAFSLMGGLALIGLWRADSDKQQRLSDDAILTTALLYAAGAVFVFAPNTAQEFFGWASTSFLAATLIHLSHRHTPPQVDLLHRLHSIGSITASLEQRFATHVWQPVTKSFPSWLVEQIQVLEQSCTSMQLLAASLGGSVILLSWLW